MRCYEFVDLCKEFSPTKIILDSRNQKWEYSPLRFYLTFSDIMFNDVTGRGMYLTYKTIEERKEKGSIYLGLVSKVKVAYLSSDSIKAVVYCEDEQTNGLPAIKQKFTLLLMR